MRQKKKKEKDDGGREKKEAERRERKTDSEINRRWKPSSSSFSLSGHCV